MNSFLPLPIPCSFYNQSASKPAIQFLCWDDQTFIPDGAYIWLLQTSIKFPTQSNMEHTIANPLGFRHSAILLLRDSNPFHNQSHQWYTDSFCLLAQWHKQP